MIWSWFKKIFFRWFERRSPPGRHARWPTRDEIAALPPFEGLALEDIVVVFSPAAAEHAYEKLSRVPALGFDTESQPTFIKGQVSTGPHIIQFATLESAYIFMLHDEKTKEVACRLIEAPDIKKVGFGLSDDLRKIPVKLNIQPQSVLDLESVFNGKGYGRGVGVKVGVAIAFKRRFLKSKRASTSNWKRHRLSDKQILYAANDAYAAIWVYHALKDGLEKKN